MLWNTLNYETADIESVALKNKFYFGMELVAQYNL